MIDETKVPEEKIQPNLSDKSLAELSEMFRELMSNEDRMGRLKEAEAIKSAFYKLLVKLKGEAAGDVDKFTEVEENFKSIYADYKRERAEYNKEEEARRQANLITKQAVIDELKALVDNQEDVSASFPAFRELQDRWRQAGPVPVTSYRDLNDTYQFYVEKFYDMVKINRDLRDLDFKKNLEAKTALCEAAEKLAEEQNVLSAFAELQKLHEQWKEYGPVAAEFRESIWDRFKAATTVVNKRYQAHFEALKDQQEQNLEAKTRLCEEVEDIAARDITTSGEWNSLTREIEKIQARWRTIGYATKKENQKIYDRFRAACDAFFAKKRVFYAGFKDQMEQNFEKKMAIIEQAEALKSSTEWKKTTDQFISLQKQWKEIGAVPRKKSDALWKRFRAACDEFFAERDKNAKPGSNFYANLKLKKALIEEISAWEPSDEQTANAEAMRSFADRWQEIGFVPFKEKEAVNQAYQKVMKEKFPLLYSSERPSRQDGRQVSAKESLIRKFNALQQDIETYENNIGFFSASKNSEPLIAQMRERIDQAKAELRELEEKIHQAEEKTEE